MREGDLVGGRPWTMARERWLLLTLAAIQFTTIVDFLIVIPLGPQYEAVFHIGPRDFGLVVAAYGIAAGITGLIAGFVLDYFDRKPALVTLYFGFTLGTLFCAIAPTYHLLVAARFTAGAFGGVCGAVILAIVGDVVPMERRGAAMGLVMSSFSVSTIVGVPAGLYIAEHSGWNAPFYVLAALSGLTVIVVAVVTPPLQSHLRHAPDEHPFKRTLSVMLHPDHQKAFALMVMLTFASFCIFPYMPDYMVKNVGLTKEQLKWIYLCGGICTVFSMNWVGRWSDRSGKLRVFTFTSLSTAVPILLLTNLPRVPVPLALCVSTLLMVCMSSRFVPAMAMMTGAVEGRYRGGFMSINSSVQQFSMGLASYVSGWIIGETADHQHLTHYPINGILSVTCAYTAIYLARFLKPVPDKEVTDAPVMAESV